MPGYVFSNSCTKGAMTSVAVASYQVTLPSPLAFWYSASRPPDPLALAAGLADALVAGLAAAPALDAGFAAAADEADEAGGADAAGKVALPPQAASESAAIKLKDHGWRMLISSQRLIFWPVRMPSFIASMAILRFSAAWCICSSVLGWTRSFSERPAAATLAASGSLSVSCGSSRKAPPPVTLAST